MRLTLRPADDRAIVELTGIRSDALIGVQPPARRAVAPASPAKPPASRPDAFPARAQAPPPAPRRTAVPAPHVRETVQAVRGTTSTIVAVDGN